MKVRFLKNHVNWKTGDIASIDDSMAAYMLLCGVVEAAEVDTEKQEAILLDHLEENKGRLEEPVVISPAETIADPPAENKAQVNKPAATNKPKPKKKS